MNLLTLREEIYTVQRKRIQAIGFRTVRGNPPGLDELYGRLTTWAETELGYQLSQTSQLLIAFGKFEDERVNLAFGFALCLAVSAMEQCVDDEGRVTNIGMFEHAAQVLKELPAMVEDAGERQEVQRLAAEALSFAPAA